MKIFLYICLSLVLFIGCGKKSKKERKEDIDPSINYYIEGMTQLRRGNNDAAIVNLEKQIKIKKKDVHAYLLLANLYMQSKNFKKAITILEKAINTQLKNPDIYFLLTQCYSQLNNNKKAIESIKTSIEMYEKNNNRTSYLNALKIYKSLKNSKKNAVKNKKFNDRR